MKIGIVGLPFVGKSTIYNLLVGEDSSSDHLPGDTRTIKVHDSRIDKLSEMYEPKKTTYAFLQFTDTPGLDPTAGSKERNRVFGMIQKIDALLWVTGNFDGCASSPLSQLEDIKSEIILRDLELVENRLDKLENAKRKLEKFEKDELEVLKKIKEYLDNEKFPDISEILPEEIKLISSLSLFSIKPYFILINSDEDSFEKNTTEIEKMKSYTEENRLGIIEICGKFEMELNSLEEDERKEFMQELGIKESGIQRLTTLIYDHVGLISFFTVGKDEVRAWTIKKNTCAKEAAGKIHSDLERGFIRAEIMKYEELLEFGSEKILKEKGLFKVVGKEYIVEDGDIINIRFNV